MVPDYGHAVVVARTVAEVHVFKRDRQCTPEALLLQLLLLPLFD
jgi:hypothetical protein